MLLTTEGEIFLHRVEPALDILHDALRELEDYKNLSKGNIRIGIPPMIGLMYVPAIVRTFYLKHPEIRVKLTEANTRELSQMLNSRELDFALMIWQSPYSTGFERRTLLDTSYSFLRRPGQSAEQLRHGNAGSAGGSAADSV